MKSKKNLKNLEIIKLEAPMTDSLTGIVKGKYDYKKEHYNSLKIKYGQKDKKI